MVDPQTEHSTGSRASVGAGGPGVERGAGGAVAEGGTSLRLRREFPELEEFLWGDSLWADGDFAESVGSVQEELVRKYIREQ